LSEFNDVGRFHERFGLPYVSDDGLGIYGEVGPQEWDDELVEFRTKFLEEELLEFRDGVDERDHEKMFDALIDLVYVALGTAHMLGYPWREGWDEVQRANMRKVRGAVDGSDSKRESRWDVVKPDGWQPPDLKKVLEAYGFDFSEESR
jgi:predicted HAD superfamily Cof-like phosphohydrolase